MTIRGPWSRDETGRFLEGARLPLRLACQGRTGYPVLASLWFVPEGGTLWCATQRDSRTADLLAQNPRCAFEVSPDRPPYRGVRGQGDVRLHDERGAEILEVLIGRYLIDRDSDFARWLRSRAERETAIAIEPRTLVTWDFSSRMGAVA